jgi:VWFA-related protein
MALSRSLALLTFLCIPWNFLLAQSDSAAQTSQNTSSAQAKTEASDTLTIRTTVRRVIVDVVVRDSNNKPVHDLTASDFFIFEDGHPQSLLAFDVHNFDTPSISLPANSPHLAVNNFVNIPIVPERGPLYVILYDLVNMEDDDQIDARRQILKFIKSKPAGTRFAIYVRTDGLYLVQGFTADKDQLYAALNPDSPKPHVPRVFLMGRNYGRRDPLAMIYTFIHLSEFLDGIPGRKNLIWLSGAFPLSIVPRVGDPHDYGADIRNEIDRMTREQIAVYPINVRGVVVNPEGAPTGARPHGGSQNTEARQGSEQSSATAETNAREAQNAVSEATLFSSLQLDYAAQRELARSTGGRAFFTNDVMGELAEVTEVDGNYYSLTYSPTNQRDDGVLRNIEVKLPHAKYDLSYRRAYYALARHTEAAPENASATESSATLRSDPQNDALQSNIKHGAPMVHDLLFSAHIHADGIPAKASAEKMTELAEQPAYVSTRHKDKPLAPVDLQKYVIDYRVTDLALKGQAQNGKVPSFEFAVAAFDADSRRLNGIVNNATADTTTARETSNSGVFRVRQELDVPAGAAWIRIGVRDKLTNRMGTLEVQLPLAPEAPSPSVTSAR